MRKRVSTNSHDDLADLPTNAKLRAFRCQDFAEMSRTDRLAYANAIITAIRADNQRRGQSYKPKWQHDWQCQAAYDQHMKEQHDRQTDMRQKLAANVAEQWAKERVAAAIEATKTVRKPKTPQIKPLPGMTPLGIKPSPAPIVIEPIAEPIVIKQASILPALLAEHFDVSARKLAGHLIYQAQQEQVDREADIAVAVTNFCMEMGI